MSMLKRDLDDSDQEIQKAGKCLEAAQQRPKHCAGGYGHQTTLIMKHSMTAKSYTHQHKASACAGTLKVSLRLLHCLDSVVQVAMSSTF